jgi:hypothetical protein
MTYAPTGDNNGDSSTFLTGLGQGQAPSPEKPTKSKAKATSVKEPSSKAGKANQSARGQETEEPAATASHPQVDVSDPYEDSDFTIYFDKKSLLSFFDFIEDDNLFKVHHVEADE